MNQYILALLSVLFCIGLLYVVFRFIKKSNDQFRLMRQHASEIAFIRLPVEWLDKRDQLNALMEDNFFMSQRSGEYYGMLDEMMGRRYDAIMQDVDDIGKAAIFKRAAERPGRNLGKKA